MFSGIDWVNKNIPENSKAIIINRPIANLKNLMYQDLIILQIQGSNHYKKLIKKYNIDILYI